MASTEAPDRREQIVQAALELVQEGGLDTLSVRAVAGRAGIGASTLRHYFPRQRDLNVAVASRLMSVQLDDSRIHDPNVVPAERLLECLSQFLAGDDDRTHLVAWLDLLHGAVMQGEDSLRGQILAGFGAAGRGRVVAWLEQLASEGHLDPAEVERGAVALLVRLDGLGLAMLDPSTPVDRAEAERMLADDVDRLLAS
jgi:AcrR family transcriptional regulator